MAEPSGWGRARIRPTPYARKVYAGTPGYKSKIILENKPMNRGYTLLWRKCWDNPVLKDRGKRFSKFEAWLYLVNVCARGMASDGLERGEFRASYRYLGKAWRWSVDAVFRFIRNLEAAEMIKRGSEWSNNRAERPAEHQPEHFAEHFIICNYSTYNPPPNTLPNAPPNTLPNEVKKVLKKVKEGINREVRKRATSTPEEFPISDTLKEWAVTKTPNLDLERETEKFLDHHRSKGSTFMDWTAAWRTWMGNSRDWGHSRGNGGKPEKQISKEDADDVRRLLTQGKMSIHDIAAWIAVSSETVELIMEEMKNAKQIG